MMRADLGEVTQDKFAAAMKEAMDELAELSLWRACQSGGRSPCTIGAPFSRARWGV